MALTQAAGKAAQHAKDNPKAAVAVGAGVLVCAVPALVAAPALGLTGFGANGIVGGSLAAGAQSGIGSVVAPSLFATLQSAGAGGYGLSAVYGAVQGAAAVGAGGSLAASFGGKKKNDKEKKGDKYDEESEADEGDEGDEKKPAENKSGEAGGESKDDNKPRL
ncbi:uncharacterized protein NECHADRAFT_79370 [Fusarium vanettenii 77-13-4]|uniref:Interferon-induced 6-16 n=1 Tax=Fusarium vanettenii (strain ATCC MYA-4622 / CBS 123669 / FGSC 9596 / NRRL 45880 / 77-13-4) TaxID=660122 RepID=C7YNN8_FUSV7|nr:uncharacterized protein NECHADRAFT_79370 [Fusarium vanettenii 77-13-4]EEU46606.1 hypothetical protein NECHADRAFT_79370 [Fusarium vanettenii 77-13-4]